MIILLALFFVVPAVFQGLSTTFQGAFSQTRTTGAPPTITATPPTTAVPFATAAPGNKKTRAGVPR